MAAKDSEFDELRNQLIRKQNQIKDFHIIVQWVHEIDNQSINYFVLDPNDKIDDKWEKISKMFRGLGYSSNKHSADKCREKFYKWSESYAKKYDKLNAILETETQEIFDLMKIVHILDSKQLDPITDSLLKEIAKKDEIKDYLNDLENRKLGPKPKKTKSKPKSNGGTGDNAVELMTSNEKKPSINSWAQTNGRTKRKIDKNILSNKTANKVFKRKVSRNVENNVISSEEQFKEIGEMRRTVSYEKAICDQMVSNFDDMNLRKELLRGIHENGLEEPSPIQQRAIVPCIEGRDVLAQAKSGTGKTAAFVIPSLQLIDTSLGKCQVLILAPTRELVQQIKTITLSFGKHIGVRCHASIGGYDIREEVLSLKFTVHIVVGTPGIICDLIHRKALPLNHIKLFVLDELDQMLRENQLNDSQSLSYQVFQIIEILKPTTQLFFSFTTLPIQSLRLSQYLMRDPTHILVNNEELTLEGIQQFYVLTVTKNNKFNSFCDLYKFIKSLKCLVYCNTREGVDRLNNKLKSRRITVTYIHGDMEQSKRQDIVREFRFGSCPVLITSDLLGRGIDVQQVSLVINYDLPQNVENYIHRVGRSGRFGRKGMAISLVTNKQMESIRKLEKFYNTNIEEMPTDFTQIL